MSASDQIDGNRLIFKPSPLQGLKKGAGALTPEPARAEPLEVTAIPDVPPRVPEARPPVSAAHRDDVTTFSLEPLPAVAPEPAERADPAPAPDPGFDQARALTYVLLAAAAGAVLLALIWLGLI